MQAIETNNERNNMAKYTVRVDRIDAPQKEKVLTSFSVLKDGEVISEGNEEMLPVKKKFFKENLEKLAEAIVNQHEERGQVIEEFEGKEFRIKRDK